MVLEIQRMNGTIYTDLTGAFPVTSARGNKLLYIAYSYDANGIIWEPMKSKNDSEISRVFKTVYEKMEKRGIKLKLHIKLTELQWHFLTRPSRISTAHQAILT